MNKYVKRLMVIASILVLATGCEDALTGRTRVRFRNDSATKTVYAVWDGTRVDNLAPGERSEYFAVNAGTHTVQWYNAANGRSLTSIGWPNIVSGNSSTFPYSD